jgi:O-acetyl-ADP-ribose deacetylase (regulator of RNase III)
LTSRSRIAVALQNITREELDAILAADDEHVIAGGGVDGEIPEAATPQAQGCFCR